MLAYTAYGSVVVDSWVFGQISPDRVIFFPTEYGMSSYPADDELFVPLDFDSAGTDSRRAWFRCSMGANSRDTFVPFEMLASGRRTIIRTSFYKDLRKPGVVARSIWDLVREGPANERWTILESGICEAGRIDFIPLLGFPETAGFDGLTELFGVKTQKAPKSYWHGRRGRWPISSVWAEASASVVIPYDVGRRKENYKNVYSAFGRMIEHYETAEETKGKEKSAKSLRDGVGLDPPAR
jgi:hypothetical protein